MILKKLEIEFQEWGEFKGKYTGRITFKDGTTDSFMFGLTPEVCAEFIQPISKRVVASSKELGKKLAETFLRELSEKPKEIELP